MFLRACSTPAVRGASALVLAAAACRPESFVTVEHSRTAAVVYGRVLRVDGAPVAGATVRTNVHDDATSCRPGGPGLTGGAPAITDADGRYRQRVWAPVSPADLCVSAQAVPAAGSGLPAAGVAGVRVHMRPDSGPLDSVRVDVRLP